MTMAYADGDSDLRGVGGWMYLFLFGFALVTPLQMVIGTASTLYGDPQIAANIGERWGTYQAAVWAMIALGLSVIGYVVWRLFNCHDPLTVRITILAIPGVAFGLPLLDLLSAVTILGVDGQMLLREMAPQLGRAAFYCVIWCWYFNVSKRVHNTYLAGPEDDTAQVFQ